MNFEITKLNYDILNRRQKIFLFGNESLKHKLGSVKEQEIKKEVIQLVNETKLLEEKRNILKKRMEEMLNINEEGKIEKAFIEYQNTLQDVDIKSLKIYKDYKELLNVIEKNLDKDSFDYLLSANELYIEYDIINTSIGEEGDEDDTYTTISLNSDKYKNILFFTPSEISEEQQNIFKQYTLS